MKRLLTRYPVYLGLFVCFFGFSVALIGQGDPAQKTARQLEMERYEKLHPTLAIGATAPDFSLVDSNGKKHQLSEYKNSPILAIVWTCTHCPYAQLYEDRIQKMYEEYGPKGVAVVAINPNAALAASPGELAYTDVDDSFEAMAVRMKLRGLTYPYLYDGGTQETARKYGPKTTPHIMLFDKDRKLRYEGRIDDNMRINSVKILDARNALDEMLAGKPVTVPHTAAFGCSTKWADQIEGKQKSMKDWAALPVNIEPATADTLKQLRANSTSGKVLLVSFYSAGCARCDTEFPALLESYRWFQRRNFDLVTVSTDGPDSKAAVQKLLDKHHSAVRNLQFASADVKALQTAFAGKQWDTKVPYMVAIGADGKIVYEKSGQNDILIVRRTVLANFDDKGTFLGNAAYWAENLKKTQR